MGNCINNQNNLNNLAKATYNIPEYSLANNYLIGKVVDVYDGDTLHIVFKINSQLTKYNCRLLEIDAPEICPKNISLQLERTLEISHAIKSRNWLIKQITGIDPPDTINKQEIKKLCGQSRKLIWVKCHHFDKYGRLLVELFVNQTDTISLNKQMIKNKYAIEYDGGTKKHK
jgi:endonuclease YncB( thermonuclease family)